MLTLREGLWLAAAAVLLFWMVGAHNRLVALRNRIGAAWAQVDEPLRRRRESLPPLIEALRGPLEAEQGALQAVLAAQAASQAAADRLRAKPVNAEAAAALAAAEGPLAAALARLRSLVEQQPGLAAAEPVAGWLLELREADQRFAHARVGFNDAVAAYNAARHQVPTRLVAGIFGLSAAGPL